MSFPKKELILTLTRHLFLGWLLMPYWTIRKLDGVIEVEEPVDTSFSSATISFTEVERKLVQLMGSYSEKSLMKVYSKEKNTADFLRKMTDKQLKENIRPYIEKKHHEIINLACLHSIPVYQRDTGQKELFTHNSIRLLDTYVQVTFNFHASESYFRYFISCVSNDKTMELQGKAPVVILASKPACIVIDRTLYRFETLEAHRLTPFFNKSYVQIPASFTRKYIESIVLPAIESYPVCISGFSITEENTLPVAGLSIVKTITEQPALSLYFRYKDKHFTPRKGTRPKYAFIAENSEELEVHVLHRELAWEQQQVDFLLQLGLKRIGDSLFILTEANEGVMLFDFIILNLSLLKQHFEMIKSNLSSIYFIGDISLQQNVITASDWFDIKILVCIGDFQFPFIRFKRHIMNGIREFMLPDDTIALLPVEWFTEYKELFSFGEEKEEGIRLKKVHYKLLETWWDESDSQRADFDKLTRSYANASKVQVPPRIKATLRTYQQEGFSWMVHLSENNFGGCLADDMGLGKTIQTITLLQHHYAPEAPESYIETPVSISLEKVGTFGQLSLFSTDTNDESEPTIHSDSPKAMLPATLIVLPTSLLHNWKREIQRFSSLTVYEYTGANRTRSKDMAKLFRHYNLILTTYGVLRNDIEYLSRYLFEYIVLDESQYIKNSESIIYSTVMALQGKHRLVLTGTPIENSLKDLWAQFNFINPGLLGSANGFRNNFIIPITKEGNTRMEARLQRLIQPFFLRRTKEQVAPELPPLTEEVLYCEMSAAQEEVYLKEKNMLRNALLANSEAQFARKNTFVALQGITRLRLLANHPQMVLSDYSGFSGKMEQIIHYYETLIMGGHKVLIFSSFVKHLRLLAAEFDKHGWRYAMLTGQTQNREEEILRFSSAKDISCFFISLKAGGVGLNLTEADYVFIIDPWWNPAAEMQAVSRAHRIGQHKQVIVYRFISSGTIEEKIIKLQEEKSVLAETFITNNNPLEGLSNREIENLFE